MLQLINMRRPNLEHYSQITRTLDKTDEIKSIEINDKRFHYTESKEIKDETLKRKFNEYITDLESDWTKAKDTISYIITSIVITLITSTILTLIITRKVKINQKRINLIEGFLPTGKQVNVASNIRKQDEELRRHSSVEIDRNTQYVLDRIAFGRRDYI